jgi:CubicO group peptidase (beta-lactamase class C family)
MKELKNNIFESLSQHISDAVREFMQDPRTVGLSVGVIIDGATLTRHFGEVRRGSGQPPTDSTLYEIGSISKTFTGLMLAQAELDGKVQSTDDVQLHLREAYPNLEYQGQPVLLWHLISHVSGLPYMLPDKPDLFREPDFEKLPAVIVALLENYTRDRFLSDLHAVVIDQPPGQDFRYSNAGAMLLGYILEDLYGLSFEQLLQARIADPFGMHATTSLHPAEASEIASGHGESGRLALALPVSMHAAGGIRSTISDMLRYVARHLDENDPAIELSHKVRWGDPASTGIGLNWQIAHSPGGYRRIWQSGGTFGFSSYCAGYPQLRIGIVLLANEFDPGSQGRLERAASTILDFIDT